MISMVSGVLEGAKDLKQQDSILLWKENPLSGEPEGQRAVLLVFKRCGTWKCLACSASCSAMSVHFRGETHAKPEPSFFAMRHFVPFYHFNLIFSRNTLQNVGSASFLPWQALMPIISGPWWAS